MDINDVLDHLDEEVEVVQEQDEDLLRAYGLHKSEDVRAVRGDKTARGEKMAHYMHMIHVHPDIAESYFRLGQLMKRDEIVRLRSRDTVDRRDLWAMGIKYDPTNARAYYHLARDLAHIPSEESISFPDGRTMTAQELCIEAIRHKLDFAECYYYLSTLLPDATTDVVLHNGRRATRRELQLDTVSLDKTIFYAFSSIAYGMEIDDVLQFEGKSLMKNDFYALAIHYGPHDARAYVNLAANLQRGESMKLLDGRKMSRRELYMAAIKIDDECIQAYFNLAIEIGSGEEITLTAGGTIWTKRSLLCHVLDLDPYYQKAYGALAHDLRKKEVILLRDPEEDLDDEPTPKTKRMLYALAGFEFEVPIGLNDDEDHLLKLQTQEVTQEELDKLRQKELKKRRIMELRRQMDEQNVAESKGQKLPRRRRESKKKKKKKSGAAEVPVPEKAELAPGTRLRLARFFRTHAPEKLDEMDKLLPLFAGREESRFKLLIDIYGPEPSAMEFVEGYDDVILGLVPAAPATPATPKDVDGGKNTSISVSSSSGQEGGGGSRGASYSPPQVPSPKARKGSKERRAAAAEHTTTNVSHFDHADVMDAPNYGGRFDDTRENSYEMLNFNQEGESEQRSSYF